MSEHLMPPVGSHVSIPVGYRVLARDYVEVTAVFPHYFAFRSLIRDAEGTFPRKWLNECRIDVPQEDLCEHMNDEVFCVECDGE